MTWILPASYHPIPIPPSLAVLPHTNQIVNYTLAPTLLFSLESSPVHLNLVLAQLRAVLRGLFIQTLHLKILKFQDVRPGYLEQITGHPRVPSQPFHQNLKKLLIKSHSGWEGTAYLPTWISFLILLAWRQIFPYLSVLL